MMFRHVLLLTTVLLVGSTATWAQEPVADAAGADEDTPFREQTIYIPYAKLREVFEREGRGVFLPYAKFRELWEAAREQTEAPPESGPPVEALIAEAENEATVEPDVVRVSARLKIELLKSGWSEVPLRLANAAIRSATIGDQPARIVPAGDGGYRLLARNPTNQPQQIEVRLEYARAIAKAPGQNSVSFQPPQAPVNRWRIRIPQAGVKVNIQPLIAAAEAPSEPDEDQPGANPDSPPAEETVVLAFVGAAEEIRIDWTPKAEGAAGLSALASVQCDQEVDIDEGAVRTRTRLTYNISRAELSRLSIQVPSDQRVAGVFDPNVRQWEVAQADEVQTITVQLFEPARGVQSVTVELERFSDQIDNRQISAPLVRALDVARQYGILVVRLADTLRGEMAAASGLTQVDAADLPRSRADRPWAFAYRYATVPYELTLSVEKVQPRITAEQLIEADLEPERLALDLLVIYNVERAGVFQFELEIPAGFELRQVRGHAAAGAQAAVVDSFHKQGDDSSPRLAVNLARRAMGRVALLVELEQRLSDPNLLTPTGEAAEIVVPVPRVASDSVARSRGRLVVSAPESLRVNPAQQEGLRTISFKDAYEGIESVQGQKSPGSRKVLALAFDDQAAALSLNVERRKPYVTARQLLSAHIDAGVVRYNATFFYDVRYSGVKTVRIDVPADLAGEIRQVDAAFRVVTMDPPPGDLAEGYVARIFSGDADMIGQFALRLTWERQIEELDVGKSVDIEMPRLMPKEVDRSWGQIVLAKAETIDVQPSGKPHGLRPIDPQHELMAGASVPDAAAAFEFHDDWGLQLTATRYQLEELKRTSIERAVLRMVVNRQANDAERQVGVQALYRLRSVRQRIAISLPQGVQFDTEPLRINGRAVALERGDQDSYFVPLVGQDPDQPLLLELRYVVPGDPGQLALPEFPDEPAVQKVYLCVFLPEELTWLGWTGPWNSEAVWRLDENLRWRPVPQQNDQQLTQWVAQGIRVADRPQFQTDGRLYVFSTLRPPPPPNGSLRLITLDRRWLNLWIFGAIALAGLALVRSPAPRQFTALAALLIALILCGVFLPTFSRQMLGLPLLLALGVVVLVWMTRYAMVMRTHWADSRAARMAAQSEAQTRSEGDASPVSEDQSETQTEGQPSESQLGESNRSDESDAESGGSPPGDDAGGESDKGGPSDA